MDRRLTFGGVALLGALLLALRERGRDREPPRLPRPETARHHVVVLGGGFGGLYTVKRLAHTFEHDPDVAITLIDRRNYHLFTPMLPLVAGGLVQPRNVVYPIRRLSVSHPFLFREGEITDVDLEHRLVYTSTGVVPYTTLVLALGSETNYFGLESVRRVAYPFKTVGDAMRLRNHVIDLFEQAALEQDPGRRRELLTFVVAGGGATGVEVAAELHDFIHHSLVENYPNLSFDEVSIYLVEAKDRVLPNLDPGLSKLAHESLRAKGVEVLLQTAVRGASQTAVELADGRRIPTRTVVWVTGIKGNPVVEALPVPHGKGGTVVVNEFLQVEGRPEVFALGDNAWCLDPRTRRPLPPDAKIAVQQAEYVARNVAHAIRGEPLEPFEYRYIGEIIPLGNFNAVAEVYGFKLAGFPAWVAWRLFYLNRLQGLKNRVRVVVDWLLAFVFPRDTSRLEQPAAPPEHVAPVAAARTAASAPPPRPPAS